MWAPPSPPRANPGYATKSRQALEWARVAFESSRGAAVVGAHLFGPRHAYLGTAALAMMHPPSMPWAHRYGTRARSRSRGGLREASLALQAVCGPESDLGFDPIKSVRAHFASFWLPARVSKKRSLQSRLYLQLYRKECYDMCKDLVVEKLVFKADHHIVLMAVHLCCRTRWLHARA